MTQFRLLPLLFVSLSLAAQTPYLVRDINTTYNSATAASSPAEFATFGNRIAFTASPDRTNRELWITDGSASGTTKLLTVAATTTYFAAPIAVRNTLLFSARDVNHGSELWASDGTAAGTHMLLDLNPGPSSADPGDHIVYKNLLFFSADDGTHGRELWTSDGTAGGTRLFKDIVPGTPSSFVGNFIPFQGDLYSTRQPGCGRRTAPMPARSRWRRSTCVTRA
jgi:ELWxxDGT repeat protein